MIPNHYRFMDDHVEVRTDRPGDMQNQYPYDKIDQVHENKGYFYIGLGAGRICIIGCSDFTRGTADDLRKLLMDKLGERFVRKN